LPERQPKIAGQGGFIYLPASFLLLYWVSEWGQEDWIFFFERDHTNETNALAQSEPDSRHSGEGERPTANLLGNGVKKTYIACTDLAYEPLVPTHEWVRRQNGWQYLEFASGHDAMVIRPEA
jgi:hypothetical protein